MAKAEKIKTVKDKDMVEEEGKREKWTGRKPAQEEFDL